MADGLEMVSNQAPMRLRARVTVGLLACLPLGLILGCAPRGPSPALVAEAAKARALVQQGCYACLKESLAIYDKLSSAKASVAGTAEGRFDAALLLAIREKELGIPGDESMGQALRLLPAALADRPPVAQDGPATVSRQAVYDAALLIIGDTTSLDPDQRALVTGRNRPPLEPDNQKRRALDAAPENDLAARYVALSIDCEQQKLIESVDAKTLAAAYAAVPLMQFRLSTCGRPATPNAGALREGDPRWTDTLYWEGRSELRSAIGRAIDFPKVLSLYGQGREAFPASLMLTLAWANANLISEEFEGALAGFDDVLAKYPSHRDAMNGKMQAQSYLLRHPDAIATATRLLELGTWHIADANYWRAWNRYHLKEYDAAWDDVENATKGLSNSRVYMLAGLIAYARKDLPIAVERFDRAYQLDPSACDATWMSGLVSIDQNELAIAAPKFTRGMSCFVTTAGALRDDRTRTEASIKQRGTPATPREQRNLDRLQRDADTADEKSAQSAYNAAQCYARTGEKRQALTLIDVAIAHPRMSEKAIAMKAAIEKLPN
jgi:tetratricopeptide (TPR) repeat protein